MNAYWEKLLSNVLQQSKEITDLSAKEPQAAHYVATRNKKRKPKPRQRIYPLGKQYASLYLTPQETACLLHLLKGCSVPKTAQHLNLSKRTVEFYLKKIKIKFNCKSNIELVGRFQDCELDMKYNAYLATNVGQAARR